MSKGSMHVGIIGCGQWGWNHLRIFWQDPNAEVAICCDRDTKRLDTVKRQYPDMCVSTDHRQALSRKDIDAVVVATPASTHYPIVKEALSAGKDVLCEKPLTTDTRHTAELVRLAKKHGTILMVGYTFLFNAGILKLKELIDTNVLGRIFYIRTLRTNLGPVRSDVNVVWDLASHDISILWYLLKKRPIGITAQGGAFLQPAIDDLANISLSYPGNIVSHSYVSWLEPCKKREIIVVGEKKMARWDDMDPVAPVTVYDKNVPHNLLYNSFGEFHLYPHEGDIVIPKIALSEPLKAEDEYFLECVKKRKQPFCNAVAELSIIETLEAVQKAMRARGQGA